MHAKEAEVLFTFANATGEKAKMTLYLFLKY